LDNTKIANFFVEKKSNHHQNNNNNNEKKELYYINWIMYRNIKKVNKKSLVERRSCLFCCVQLLVENTGKITTEIKARQNL
jgi:hypothetical protein